jgi:transformer-2 protein
VQGDNEAEVVPRTAEETVRSPSPAGREKKSRSGSRSRSRSHSRSRSPRRRPDDSPRGRSRFGPKGTPPPPSNVLGVFGLSHYTRQRDLEDIFSKFGNVKNANLVMDRRSNQSRGFGFIYFESTEEAERALKETNGMRLDGRYIRVDFSATKRAHSPTPGQYMGERGMDRGHDRGRDRGYGRGGDRGYDRGDRGMDRGYDRGYDRDNDRGYDRSNGRGYGRDNDRGYDRRRSYRSRSRERHGYRRDSPRDYGRRQSRSRSRSRSQSK